MATKRKITQRDKRLGKRIQKIRKSKDITQEQLAEKINVSTTWIGYVEIGYRRPNLKMLTKIAKALGVRVKDLIPY